MRKRGIKCKLEAYDGYKHVDISIEWARVNIEVDGKHHLFNPKQLEADYERDSGSEEDGIRTIRVPNSLIEENVNGLADSIAKVVRKRYREEDEF